MIDPRVFISSFLGAATGTAAAILVCVGLFWVWLVI